jgi:hypothetical protein
MLCQAIIHIQYKVNTERTVKEQSNEVFFYGFPGQVLRRVIDISFYDKGGVEGKKKILTLKINNFS